MTTDQEVRGSNPFGRAKFFFPGPRNHFERLAGLESGGYERIGIAPVIGWPQVVVLLAAAALSAALVWRALRRRRSVRLRSVSPNQQANP